MHELVNVVIYLSFNIIASSWVPELNFQPDFNQFHIYDSSLLNNIIYSQLNGKLPDNFEWQTISSVSLSSFNVSYVFYGGLQQMERNSNSSFNLKMSTVIICEMKLPNVKCQPMKADNNSIFLGASIKAISLSSSKAVFVYCDPLWHMTDKIEPKPSGKCYFSLIDSKIDSKSTSIEFCKLSSKSFISCMGGFSFDLISLSNDHSGIEMIVGMPYKISFGGVNIVNDPFGAIKISEPRNGVGKYYNFGYAVSMTKNGVAYVSSPLSDQYGPNVTDIRNDLQMTSPDQDPFSSFGVSLTTLSIKQNRQYGVVIGAPFHTVKSVQNVGKVYIFCSTNTNQSVPSDSIFGVDKDEFFGYSLANIGDINADGNDDLAIGSPFLRDDDARGFVTIYTINEKCETRNKPHQILKANKMNNIGIYGIAITGGSDLDFNEWPDIVVGSTRSNSIELFGSRKQYKARCTYHLNNNYETKELSKDELVPITMYLSMLNLKKDNFIDMNLFKQYKLISQIDPNINVTTNRFILRNNNITFRITDTISAKIDFTVQSLENVKDMNLSSPIVITYRFVQDCDTSICNNLLFPLINWENCMVKIPVQKYICSENPICDADIEIDIVDKYGNEVMYEYDKSYQRSLTVSIFNNGPSEAKDVNFKITTFQNLRIDKIYFSKGINVIDIISPNQTVGIVKLDQVEIDPKYSLSYNITIDLYFIDFKDSTKMKYENNSVTIELFSDVSDTNLTNNNARIDYKFIYDPNISLSASSKHDSVVDTRNRSQLLRKGMRMSIDKIGPRLTQTYIIDNVGKAVIRNLNVKISIPINTRDNFYILYLFDKIRGVNRSQVTWMSIVPHVAVGFEKYRCILPMEYVNPLEITAFETHVSHISDIDVTEIAALHFLKKRSLDQSYNSKYSNSYDDIKILQGKVHRNPTELIQCNRPGVNLQSPFCVDIICHIPSIPTNKQARIQINGWLVAYTFFKKKIPDLQVATTLSVNFNDLPPGVSLRMPDQKSFSQYQQFVFRNIKRKIVHFKSLWPIIVGIVIGILILAILIVAMYKCGFFKRSKRRRHFRSKKSKRPEMVITHPHDLQQHSSITSDKRFTSHSALITSDG